MIPTLATSLLLLCSIVLPPPAGAPAGSGSVPGASAGFSEAHFDTATLQEMLGRSGCTGVRLYNVKRDKDDAAGTAMAIGIAGDGTEQSGWLGPKYQRSTRLDGSRALADALSTSSATEACELLRAAGGASIAADFSAADVTRLLATAGCNGLKVVPSDLGDGSLTMTLVPVRIHDGVADEVAGGERFLCTQPCPTFCGRLQNYVNTPR